MNRLFFLRAAWLALVPALLSALLPAAAAPAAITEGEAYKIGIEAYT